MHEVSMSEVRKRWEAGELVLVGEYRMSKKEILEWRDKTSGRPLSAPLLRHTIEFGSVSVQMAERVPDNVKLEDIVVHFIKGDQVAAAITEWVVSKGSVSCRGTLEKISANGASPGPGKSTPVAGGKSPQS
jgi:hypothetical protein